MCAGAVYGVKSALEVYGFLKPKKASRKVEVKKRTVAAGEENEWLKGTNFNQVSHLMLHVECWLSASSGILCWLQQMGICLDSADVSHGCSSQRLSSKNRRRVDLLSRSSLSIYVPFSA